MSIIRDRHGWGRNERFIDTAKSAFRNLGGATVDGSGFRLQHENERLCMERDIQIDRVA